MFDVVYILKFIRNAFISKRILYDDNHDNAIEFQYFAKLVELQEAEYFYLAK